MTMGPLPREQYVNYGFLVLRHNMNCMGASFLGWSKYKDYGYGPLNREHNEGFR